MDATLPPPARQGLWPPVLAWRAGRLAAAALCGGGLALALPPFDVLPALVGWSGLLLLLQRADRVRRPVLERALLGAAFAFGHHLCALWWVGAAFLVEADVFGPFLPVAVVGLPLLLAPFWAAATAAVGLAPPGVAWRALALAAAIGAAEVARGAVLSGFPWNPVGHQLTASLALAQGAALVGVSGLGVLAVLAGCGPALLVARAWAMGLGVAAAVVGVAMFGAGRLGTGVPAAADAPLVRVVQPAVPQHLKWDGAERAEIWAGLIELTAAPGAPDLVVWPETAFPFLYRTPSVEQFDLAGALSSGALLVAGAVDTTADGRRYTNTVLGIGSDGAVLARYDKVRLVPFGEFLPLAPVLAALGFTGLVENAGDFAAGEAAGVLRLPGLPALQPVVCYEVIFPGFSPGAEVGAIVNVTNDAWFGDTPGPRQHLRHAVMRAIERGVPVVRAANTGISAVIDAEGRAVVRLALGERGAVDARLPAARPTLWARWGDAPLAVFGAGVLASLALRRRHHSAGR